MQGNIPDTLATLDLSTYQDLALREPAPSSRNGTESFLISGMCRTAAAFSPTTAGGLVRCPCSCLVLSLSPMAKGIAALEQEIDRLHRAPNPLLRQVYSLEGAAQQSFLVEEHVIGPSLLEILRARSFLSPPETWLLLNLLAPVADHAQSNELQQVDIALSGVQLISAATDGNLD